MNRLEQKIRLTLRLLSLIALLFSSGCAWFAKRPASPPFDHRETADIVSAFKYQERVVHSVFSSGTVTFESQGAQSEAEVLIIARRDPPAVMIEITHAWGQPLLHIRVNGSRLDVVSFTEKRHYRGRLGSPRILKQIPFPLDSDLIWSLARAYPVLPPYHHARSMKGDQVTLLDKQDADLQVIDLYPDSHLPQRVRLRRQGTAISFSDLQDSGGILYAGEIRLTDDDQTALLTLDIRQMVFNKPLPEAIFQQEAPPDFEVVQL